MKVVAVVLALLGGVAACRHSAPQVADTAPGRRPMAFTLAGQFDIKPLTHFPPDSGPRFGGISSLAASTIPGEVFALSDDTLDSRVYRLRLSGVGTAFRVTPLEYILLEASAKGPAQIDPEGIAVAANGHMFITSEGLGNLEPRVPPAILEFGPRGEFVRALPVRDRYLPNPTGPLLKGVRNNIGFESLAMTAAGDRLFVGVESALVQDGDLTTFDDGAPARIIEYVRRGSTFAPAREYVYTVEPIYRPPFAAELAVNGLVELMALPGGDLLSLERSYVAEAGEAGRSMNRIRLFRVSLAGATDVSGYDSLRSAPSPQPVRKTLLLDLSDLGGLSAELAPGLDNFEGLLLGPALPDGRASLLLVSDDNFNETQRTWFVLLGLDPAFPPRLQ